MDDLAENMMLLSLIYDISGRAINTRYAIINYNGKQGLVDLKTAKIFIKVAYNFVQVTTDFIIVENKDAILIFSLEHVLLKSYNKREADIVRIGNDSIVINYFKNSNEYNYNSTECTITKNKESIKNSKSIEVLFENNGFIGINTFNNANLLE